MQDFLLRDDLFDTVIFDLDNTLVDFINAKRQACNAVIESLGCGDSADLFSYFLRMRHGFEDYGNIFDYLSDIGVNGSASYLRSCTIYEDVKLQTIQPYEGVGETLSALRSDGLRLGVVTDADSDHAEKRLKKANLSKFFEVVITPDMSGRRKPNPDSFLMALDSLRTDPFHTICVGDSIRRDIEPAKRLGMCTIHAAYGDWHPEETKESSVRTLRIHHPEDLIRLVLGKKD
ncbi:MAG: HAD family hydrolase [Methanocalculus sp.]|uniref:HAD family hydrolase n=1 Tax=Methanocalculus sp. TaxID=2004547 RepID=UPI002719F091|nr:HAD family hydrolase [Methanocalculus sp.]MDO9539026.1 HAD family hydrolase [Methanocalculus sp.]